MGVSELVIVNVSDGVELAYLDSGPVPDSNNFVTVVSVHGFLFNAYSMERLLPFAHQYNIRLIIVMRRDYPGSSQFTDEEMTLVTEDPELFLNKSGALYLNFLHYILTNTPVCKATEDRSKGGICLAGWSLGNGFAMWTLHENKLVDKKVYEDLEPYFTTYIFIDPPNVALGARRPGEEDIYDPLRAGDGMEAFRLWLSGYFNHPLPWDGTLTKLDDRGTNSGQKPSISTWTAADIERWISDFAIRSDSLVLLNDVSQSLLTTMSTEILLGRPKAFPRLRVEYFSGTATCWYCVLPWDTFSKKRAEMNRKGEDIDLRRVKFTHILGGNHFMHTDAPEGFMKIIKTSLEELPDAYTTLRTSLLD